MTSLRLSLLLIGAGLIALASCDNNTAPSSLPGATKVLLTDAPFLYNQVARVDVYIVSIQASTRPDTGGNAGDTLQTGLRTIVAPHHAYNLLELAAGTTAALGEGNVPSGEYVQVRLTIDVDSSSITLKDGTVLKQGSGLDWRVGGLRQFSVNAFTDPPLKVTDSGAIVVIDFNLGQSFRPLDPAHAAAGFTFIGFISAINSARSGSVSGTVTGAGGGAIGDASVTLWVPNPSLPTDTAAWGVASTGKTDASGAFRLLYVRPGTYVASVEPPAVSPYGIVWRSEVAVTVGQETQLGTIAADSTSSASKLQWLFNDPLAVNPTGLPYRIAVGLRVLDGNGQPVTGATVTFALVQGTGTISGTSQVTNAAGVAQLGGWTTGLPGLEVLRASVRGVAPLQASLEVYATVGRHLAITEGDNQTAPAGSALKRITVQVVDDTGAAVIAFLPAEVVGSTGGTISRSDICCGWTHFYATLGPTLGANTFTVQVYGIGSVTINATGT